MESDLLYLCDSEAALNKMSRWIGSGPRTTLAGDANADIMASTDALPMETVAHIQSAGCKAQKKSVMGVLTIGAGGI